MSTAVAPQETEIVEQVNETVAVARTFEVGSPEQARAAVEFLAKIAEAKKRNELARKFLVGPMNAHIKAINDRFKRNAEPLDEADRLVRHRLLAYKQQEDARLAAEQAALDARRQAEEAAAEAERRRQAQEAARLEREAQEAEEARQTALREAASERAREIAALGDEELALLLTRRLAEGDQEHVIVRREIESRRAAREAQQRASDARRQAEEAQQAEIAAKSAPAAVATTTQLASASGSASTRKVWRAIVVDEEMIPRQFLKIDTAAINAAVKAGEREIPGVRIEQVDELAVRSGR